MCLKFTCISRKENITGSLPAVGEKLITYDQTKPTENYTEQNDFSAELLNYAV